MVDFTKFGDNIEKTLNKTKYVGYAIAIYNGLDLEWSTGHGYAVVDSKTPMTSRTRMAVMSISKTITAAAVVKQIATMQNNGQDIDLDTKISPYLPHAWHRGPKVDDLSFRHLLTHTSGLKTQSGTPDSDSDSYESLRETINVGTPGVLDATDYHNLNFCLFRVIIPYLCSGPDLMNAFHDGSTSTFPLFVAANYVGYVIENILKPCDINGASVVPSGPTPYTLSYNIADLSKNAADSSGPDAYLHSGAGHWNMSAREYCRFIAYLRHGKIMHRSRWVSMRDPLVGDTGLGLYRYDGKQGHYYWHNGGWTGGNGAEAYSAWMAFPDGTTAVLFVNSTNNTGESPQQILAEAFDRA